MALELDQPVVRTRGRPPKSEPAEVEPGTEGLVKVRVRERGDGKIFTGVQRGIHDPLIKTDPFPKYGTGETLWVTPVAAETYDERRWVNIVADE